MGQGSIERAVAEAATSAEGRLRCARALGIARGLGVSPRAVGDAANQLKVRIVDCQLGCFAVEKARHDDLDDVPVSGALAEAIEAALVDGHLPCAMALEVASRTGSVPRQVGDVATKKGIKISGCQLGCFP